MRELRPLFAQTRGKPMHRPHLQSRWIDFATRQTRSDAHEDKHCLLAACRTLAATTPAFCRPGPRPLSKNCMSCTCGRSQRCSVAVVQGRRRCEDADDKGAADMLRRATKIVQAEILVRERLWPGLARVPAQRSGRRSATPRQLAHLVVRRLAQGRRTRSDRRRHACRRRRRPAVEAICGSCRCAPASWRFPSRSLFSWCSPTSRPRPTTPPPSQTARAPTTSPRRPPGRSPGISWPAG